MKGSLVFTLLAVFGLILGDVAAAPAEEAPAAKKCADFCTYELSPVCGYDGNCYKSYSNKCIYDTEKCKRKSNLETVDLSLCELAEKDNHPNYKTCSD